ncbi:ATP synthase subunit I [Immundisolibacter cernigliae]|uniref:ATP synthase subunit I n=2 Tax=Immundisolibacter cernigliae TaxID=1810504 RepID=A0A1B1YSW9_9GAMM|nr:ATP synthase subunit I [Immundisolibacter cernigliae]
MTDRNAAWADVDTPDAETWQPLSATEAQALRARQPMLAPSRVVVAQALAGAVTAMLAWAVAGRASVMWSALYGAAAVILPAALMARGLARSVPQSAPALGAVRLLAWEAIKLMLAVAMLALAPRIVAPLSWPALLIGMVVCLKVYWLALLWRGR